jgi:hypothetical protein
VAIPAVAALVAVVPPFQSPDETNHLCRADQVSRGAIFRRVGPHGYGGEVDDAVRWVIVPYLEVFDRRKAKASYERFAAARSVPWSGRLAFCDNPVQASYGPFTYVPQALGLGAGRLLGLRVLDSYFLARILTAAAAIALANLGLRRCRRGQLLAFIVLALPMTLFQFASTSQDALQIAGTVLIVGLATQLEATTTSRATALRLAIAGLAAVVALGRAPMVVVAFLALLPGLEAGPRRAAVLAVCLALAAMAGWFALSSLQGPLPNGLEPSQLVAILPRSARTFPGMVASTIAHSGAPWLEQGIGVLGWLDAPLPSWFYRPAMAALGLAIVVDPLVAGRPSRLARALYGVVFTLGFGGVLLIHYVGYTPVGAPSITGIQGRHLLQLVPLLGLALAVPVADPRARGPAIVLAAFFAVTSAAITLAAVMARYY